MKFKLKNFFLLMSIVTLIWSGFGPKDTFTWFLEVLPAMLGIPLLVWFDKNKGVSFPLYIVICVHCMILSLGGHYTYAEVPLGFWVQELFDLGRNHYDRLGHVFQGVTPAFIAFESLSRMNVVSSSKWLKLFCVCIALSFSAFYELIEWWTAAATGEAAEAFLGTQGDVWDTQWDMFMALCGALVTIALVRDFKRA